LQKLSLQHRKLDGKPGAAAGAVDINHPLAICPHRAFRPEKKGTGGMESNSRFYRRRAIEERMAAQRAITEAARAWHAKLAEDFAQRAESYTTSAAA
jgi:hypothetical protein